MTSPSRIFQLRTYHAAPGKFDALQDRFRNHTLGLFAKHGITLVGFWVPMDTEDTLVYLVAFDDREAVDRAWSAFREDPAWIEARAKTEAEGSLTSKIESIDLTATDYSPLK